MKSSAALLAFALTLLATIRGASGYIASSRRKKLREQAGVTAIHGEAAHSLKTEKMRIRKSNRDKGVIGELGVAKDLDYLAHEYGLTILHDLSIPGTTANIDHILLSRKVIYVIDAKNYTGIVNVAPNRAGKKTLRVGGRDQSALVSKVNKYALSVREFLESEGIRVKVLPLLAFYQAKFHQDSAHTVDGVTVNVFGIENELMRYANLKSEEIDIEEVAKLLLKKFPHKP
jgi:hypothetical protein